MQENTLNSTLIHLEFILHFSHKQLLLLEGEEAQSTQEIAAKRLLYHASI